MGNHLPFFANFKILKSTKDYLMITQETAIIYDRAFEALLTTSAYNRC